MDKYFLPDDYQENTVNLTREVDGVVYWTPRIIRRGGLYQKDVYRWAGQLVRARGLKSVMDVGCGPATKLNRFITPLILDVVGVDQESAISYCRATYKRGTYLVDDLGNPSSSFDRTFDLIICCDVIEHLENPVVVLDYIKRHARPDTLILISTPDRDRTRGKTCRTSPTPAHIREWSKEEFVKFLKHYGFLIEETRFLAPVSWFPPNLIAPLHFVRQMRRTGIWRYNLAVLSKIASGSGQ